MSAAATHDVIVVGAGPAGEVCAGRLAGEGVDVAIVERELVGGECSYWACMPSKALLRPGQGLAESNRIAGVRQAVTAPLDVEAVLERRDQVIHNRDDGAQLPWLSDRGITLYRGQGRLDGERRVRVADRLLHARRAVVIAVGSGAAMPPIEGLDRIAAWTNRAATNAESAPKRLTVLGGGAVGSELAQAWATLGAKVTLIEALPALVPGSEPFASRLVELGCTDLGIDVRTGTRVVKTARVSGRFAVTLDTGEQLRSDELLIAVGRQPHTDDLGLETVDLKPGATIRVDDQMRVKTPGGWLYAIGDVNGRALLTHVGKYQAQVACASIMNRPARAAWDGPVSPRVVFCEPQLAAVGRTLEQALADGIRARAVDADPGQTAGASFVGNGGRSGARIVVDSDREVIIGATFVGPEIAESLHAATIAIVGEVPLRTLAHAIPPFPTRTEMWLGLLEPWTQ